MEEPTSTPVSISTVILLYAVFFPIFWCGVIGLISQLSGWARLAQRYRSLLPPSGQRWNWQYGMVGWAGYNGVLILTANGEGLFMEVFPFFRFGHPRLFIPWSEFRDAEVNSFFFRRQVSAKVGFPTVVTLRLPAAVFEESVGRRVLTNSVQS